MTGVLVSGLVLKSNPEMRKNGPGCNTVGLMRCAETTTTHSTLTSVIVKQNAGHLHSGGINIPRDPP